MNAEVDGGRTPLHGARCVQNHETIEVSLKHRAAINARDDNGDSAMHVASLAIENRSMSLDLVGYRFRAA